MSELPGEQFGDTLRRVRSAAGLSQEALAERADLSTRGISDLERGRRSPRPATVQLLADALGLDVSTRSEFVRAAYPQQSPGSVIAPSEGTVVMAAAGVETDARADLPLPPTPLIGRERDVAAVLALLRSPTTRLATLVGPGGTGKTRLALQVVSDLVGEMDDGVVVVALAPLAEAELVVPTIAEALRVRESSESTLLVSVATALRDRSLLLLLDNFEHVLDAAPAIGMLLGRCPGVKVLVTSRAPLRLRGEHVMEIAPLALPMAEAEPLVEDVDRYGALALFVARVQSRNAQFVVSSANIAAVNAICQRLDGLPLAIELAAARTRVLTPEELLHLLDRRLPFLTGGARDLPERHQTLRNTIAWSDDLLTADERRTFRWLSVFAGGWTLESAAAVTGEPDLIMLDRLHGLIDHSLVRRVERTGSESDSDVHFEMLEIIREFGLEQLAFDGDAAAVGQRHADYFLSFVEQQGFDRTVTDGAMRLARVDAVYDNVRTALRWLIERRQTDMALRLCAALRQFWVVRGYLSEGQRAIDAALALDPGARTRARAWAMHAASSLACHQGDLERVDRMANACLEISQELADEAGIASALHLLGLSAQLSGDYARSAALYMDSLELKRRTKAPTLTATLGNLAQVVFHAGDVDRAIELFDETIAFDREAGDLEHLGIALTDLGLIMLERGDDDRAESLFVEALEIHREIGYVRMVTSTIEGLAALAGKHGHPERAAQLYGAVEAMSERIGQPLPDPEQWNYARYVSHARVQLDAATFSAAWAAGRAMPMTAAIRFALAPLSC